jgi:hypothetical protein
MENKNKRDFVKKQEATIKQNIEKFRLQRENMSKGQLDQRVNKETNKVLLAEEKLKQLE